MILYTTIRNYAVATGLALTVALMPQTSLASLAHKDYSPTLETPFTLDQERNKAELLAPPNCDEKYQIKMRKCNSLKRKLPQLHCIAMTEMNTLECMMKANQRGK